MARYLVTGGAGFIGSHLAHELVDRGHEVTVLDDLSGGSADRVPSGARFVEGSICDADLVDELFLGAGFDAVFHFAAFAAECISHSVKRYNYETNVLGSVNLVNAAVNGGVRLFCFASSVAVYGGARAPMRESDTPTPIDSYGIAKFAIEEELEVTSRAQGLNYAALRLHNVYGEHQNMRDPYRNAVAIFLNQILRDEPITVYGDGGQVRAFTYVRDIVGVIADLPGREKLWNRALNLGARRRYTVQELAEQVRAAMGAPEHEIAHLPARDEVREAYTDNDLIRELYGDVAETPLEEALAQIAVWAKEHGPQELKRTVRPEVGDHLLPEWARLVEARLGAA